MKTKYLALMAILICMTGCNGGGSSDSGSADGQGDGVATLPTENTQAQPLSWGTAAWGEGATWGGE